MCSCVMAGLTGAYRCADRDGTCDGAQLCATQDPFEQGQLDTACREPGVALYLYAIAGAGASGGAPCVPQP